MSTASKQLALPFPTPVRNGSVHARPKKVHKLFEYAWVIYRYGHNKHFSYDQLAARIEAEGGPRCSAAAIRRFSKRVAPDVFEFRKQFYRKGGGSK